MGKIIIDRDIFPQDWLSEEDRQPGSVCDLKTLQAAIDAMPENDDRIDIELNTNGGSVHEGIAMYDALRLSGKNIHVNVTASCHSIGVVLLLAAPAENRKANKNARFLIHSASQEILFDSLTAEDALALSDMLKLEEQAILDIYQDRTGLDEQKCRELMDSDRMYTSLEMLDMGFISAINNYISNGKRMSKNKQSVASFIERARGILNRKPGNVPVNYDHVGASGEVVLKTLREDDPIEVGDGAELPGAEDPLNGVAVLEDGTEVTVADGVITEVRESASENEETENLRAENARLAEENTSLTNRVSELETNLEGALNMLETSHKPENRVARATGNGASGKNKETSEPVDKDEVRNRLAQNRSQRSLKQS